MKKKHLYLSLALIFSGGVLTGCGGSSDTKAPVVKKDAPPADIVVNGTLCQDQNANLSCDTGEPSASNLTNNMLPKELQSAQFSNVFLPKTGGFYVAAPGSESISAYSTLIYNEMLLNPTVNGSAAKAKAYLEQAGITQALVKTNEALLLKSLTEAVKVAENAHPYKAIASVVNQLISDKSKFDVTATSDEIKQQNFVKHDITLASQQLAYEKTDHDEGIREITILPGRNMSVAGTYYHNGLIVIDTAGEKSTIKSKNLFAAIDAPRYTKDASSGASEHALRSVKSSPDGQHVYVAVVPKGEIGNELDTKYGLFRVAISDTGVADAHDAPNTKRYIHKKIGAFFIAADGKVFVEDSEQEDFIILNADLTETGNRVALPSELDIASVYFSPDATSYYVLSTGDSNAEPVVKSTLHKVDTATGKVVANVTLNISGSLDGLAFYNDGKNALAFEENFYAQVIDLKAMTAKQQLPLSEQADQSLRSAVVTSNGSHAIISGHDKNQLWIFDLNAPEVSMDKLVNLSDNARAIAVSGDGQLIVGNKAGYIGVEKMTVGDVITPDQALAMSKAYITKDSINGGLPLTVVTSDLALFTTVPGVSGPNVNWATDNSAINVTVSETQALGAVTRHADKDSTGHLTANLSYDFRDIHKTASVKFDTSVRQAPADLPAQGTTLASGSLAHGYANYVTVSPDGSRSVITFRGQGTFNVITHTKADHSPEFAIGTSDDTAVTGQILPVPYAYLSETVGDKTTVINETRLTGARFLNNDYVVVAAPNAKNKAGDSFDGALLVYKVDNDAISDKNADLISTDQFGGKILSISHVVNNHIAIVVEVTVDETTSRKAVIIDVSNPSNITQSGSEIKVSDDAYLVEVNDDASAVFTVAANVVGKYTVVGDGTPVNTIKADISGFSARSFAIGGTDNDTLFVGTSSGPAIIFAFNTSDLSDSDIKPFYTGYSARLQTLDVIGDKAYASLWGKGVAIIDLENAKELQFFAHHRQRRAGVSSDGSWVFAAQYVSRSTNEVRLLKPIK